MKKGFVIKKRIIPLIIMIAVLFAGILASCTSPEPALPGSERDVIDIYAAVVYQLYTEDHTFSKPPNFPVVYIVRATDDSVGDPGIPDMGSSVLAESVQTAIVAALYDLPAEFRWVDKFAGVPIDSETGVVEGSGAVVTLGNIQFQEDGSALVSAKIYIANLAAGGLTYVVKKVGGVWKITGDTGVRWIS